MKFTTAIAALIAAFVAGSTTAAAIHNNTNTMEANTLKLEGGFASSCKDIHIIRDKRPVNDLWSVGGVCPDNNDVEYKTTIQLNLCLANDKGSLVWAKRGRFDDSCKGCSIKDVKKDKVTMTCICKPAWDKGDVFTEIDLNEGIRNEGATFWCGDEIGTRLAH